MSRTTAPSAANVSAIARPMPLLAPVTTALRPPSLAVSDVARQSSAPPANGWRAVSDAESTSLAFGSPPSARAIDSFVAW